LNADRAGKWACTRTIIDDAALRQGARLHHECLVHLLIFSAVSLLPTSTPEFTRPSRSRSAKRHAFIILSAADVVSPDVCSTR